MAKGYEFITGEGLYSASELPMFNPAQAEISQGEWEYGQYKLVSIFGVDGSKLSHLFPYLVYANADRIHTNEERHTRIGVASALYHGNLQIDGIDIFTRFGKALNVLAELPPFLKTDRETERATKALELLRNSSSATEKDMLESRLHEIGGYLANTAGFWVLLEGASEPQKRGGKDLTAKIMIAPVVGLTATIRQEKPKRYSRLIAQIDTVVRGKDDRLGRMPRNQVSLSI